MKQPIPGRSIGRRHFVTLMAVAALLWQSVAPVLAPAPRAADDLVVVCTAHGFKTVSLSSLDGRSNPQSGQDLPGKNDCPLCPGGHSGAACLPGSAPLLVAETFVSRAVAIPEQRLSFGPARFDSFLSRAPPVVA